MIRKRSVWVLVTAMVSLVAAAIGVQPASGIAVPTPESGSWSGYATGSSVHVNGGQLGAEGPLVADTAFAFSGASVNAQGQSTPLVNEMGLQVQPADAAREAYGRGSGVEVGALQDVPVVENDLILGARAEASAHPPAPPGANPYQTALVTEELVSTTVDPIAYASTLRGQAFATWNPNWVMPMLGHPLGFGLGYAADAELLNLGADALPDGSLPAPLVATNTNQASGDRAVSQSLSVNYLVNNGDGTCGLASEARVTIAPVRLNDGLDEDPLNDTTIEFLGEWILTATATGKAPGEGPQSSVTYKPANEAEGPLTPLVRIIDAAGVTNILTTQDIFDVEGLVVDANPALLVAVGEDPRAIAKPTTIPDYDSKPTITPTEASAAVDVFRIDLLTTATTEEAGEMLGDFRLGHMETKAVVPEGGINCEIPVLKTVDKDPVTAGEDMTFTISIPRDAETLIPFPCELTNIRVVDTVGIESGEPSFEVVGGTGPNGEEGVVDGDTITFENIGNYKVGDPPLLVQVVVRILPDSGIGKLKDTVSVTATPANCKATDETVGRALGGGFFGAGGARLTGAGLEGSGNGQVTGTGELGAPDVIPAPVLPKTGGSALPAAALAAGGLAMILTMRQVNRRRQEA